MQARSHLGRNAALQVAGIQITANIEASWTKGITTTDTFIPAIWPSHLAHGTRQQSLDGQATTACAVHTSPMKLGGRGEHSPSFALIFAELCSSIQALQRIACRTRT